LESGKNKITLLLIPPNSGELKMKPDLIVLHFLLKSGSKKPTLLELLPKQVDIEAALMLIGTLPLNLEAGLVLLSRCT
jgi:hypothetical protein